MADCLFCKLINKEIPCHKLYEDNNFLAFLDIHPHALGHTVLIPKQHVQLTLNLNNQLCRKTLPVIKKVLQLLKEKLNPPAFNIAWNDGQLAGQVIPHLHIHIFPRYQNDGGGSVHSIIKNPGKLSVEEVAKLFQ